MRRRNGLDRCVPTHRWRRTRETEARTTPRTFRARYRNRVCEQFDYCWETALGEACHTVLKDKSTWADQMKFSLRTQFPICNDKRARIDWTGHLPGGRLRGSYHRFVDKISTKILE